VGRDLQSPHQEVEPVMEEGGCGRVGGGERLDLRVGAPGRSPWAEGGSGHGHLREAFVGCMCDYS
jgi:hypothetical protein